MRLGLAVALGIMVGTSPFIGLHLPICIVLATILGLNRGLTYLAANISLPWVMPFLIFGSIQLGALLINGSFADLSFDALMDMDPKTFGASWLVGSLALGTLIGVPCGLAAWGVATIYRARHPLAPDPFATLAMATVGRFVNHGSFVRRYIAGKFNQDPVYRQLIDRMPMVEPVIDVGCGRGQTLLLLNEQQPHINGVGFDWHMSKVNMAQRAAKNTSLHFSRADARTMDLPESGTILMIDVLHYMERTQQDTLMLKAMTALRPGGTLFIREIDTNRGWRSWINTGAEWLGTHLGLNRGATLHFRSAQSLVDELRRNHFDVTVTPSWGSMPFANVLIEARRKVESSVC